MGKRALILSPSGMGKSHSFQYLDPKTTFIINPDKKELPWRGFENDYKTVLKSDGGISYSKSNYLILRDIESIFTAIKTINEKRLDILTIGIDTISHSMNKSVMDTLDVSGYEKFKKYAREFYTLMDWLDYTRPNLMVFLTAHIEVADSINEKKMLQFKIPAGKLTRDALDPESLFTVVLRSDIKMVEGKPVYFFRTQTNGSDTVKSPQGMFPPTIPNNLQIVRDQMIAYYSGAELPVLEEAITAESF